MISAVNLTASNSARITLRQLVAVGLVITPVEISALVRWRSFPLYCVISAGFFLMLYYSALYTFIHFQNVVLVRVGATSFCGRLINPWNERVQLHVRWQRATVRIRPPSAARKQSIGISCLPGPQQQTCSSSVRRPDWTDRRTDARQMQTLLRFLRRQRQ